MIIVIDLLITAFLSRKDLVDTVGGGGGDFRMGFCGCHVHCWLVVLQHLIIEKSRRGLLLIPGTNCNHIDF